MASLAWYSQRLLPVIEEDLKTALRAPSSFPTQFYQMLHYHMGWVSADGQPSLENGGKRIRPLLTLLVAESVCGDFEPARPAAAAAELIHNFSLLHDDIQDGSPVRRGRPVVWKLWGSAQGINAGDALFALAFLSIYRLSQPNQTPDLNSALVQILSETCLELTRGQHLDMLFEQREDVSIADYLDMISGKTAALIAGAARMGALAAGAEPERVSHYYEFGHNLGMAFQTTDDILDIWGAPSQIGKQAAGDIRQRKKTLPVLYGLENSPQMRALYQHDAPFAEEDVQQVIALLDEHGARAFAEKIAGDYSHATRASLRAACPQGPAAEALDELVGWLLQRDR